MDATPPSPVPLVQVRNLHLTVPSAAGPVNILRGIDLDIAAGEAVGVIGPSGSGKTSLLMVLAGLERASTGSIVLAGQVVTALNEDALARLRREAIGIVFQAFHLIPTMTALENVAVPLELAGVRDAMVRAGGRWVRSGWRIGRPISRASFPAASAARGARPRLHRGRGCCWPTSRPATSTRRPAMR